jgi:hypothetical protein
MEKIYKYIKKLDKNLEVYFNAQPTAFDLGDDPVYTNNNKRKFMDFVDIESVPSETWGYIHYPLLSNYINKYDVPVCMMNGKFHTAWGDFGSLRNRAALEFECFRALAGGSRVCVGDQLHPRGKLDPTAYRHIGKVFERIEKLEPWCEGTKKVAAIGVISPNRTLEIETDGNANHAAGPHSEGVYRVLSELHLPFDFLVEGDPLDNYRLIILPDKVRLSPSLANVLKDYLKKGGKLLCTGHAGLDLEKNVFVLPNFPVQYGEENIYSHPYIRITTEQFPDIPPMDYVMRAPGPRVLPAPGAKVLAWDVDPYFNRTYDKFCSHRQTPPDKQSRYGAVVCTDQIVYIAPLLFKDYATSTTLVCKKILEACIDRLLGQRPISSNLPSTAETTLRSKGKDLILHVLHYVSNRRCKNLDTLEDIIPLHEIDIRLACPVKPKAVRLVPENRDLNCTWENGIVSFRIPRIDGYAVVHIMDAL